MLCKYISAHNDGSYNAPTAIPAHMLQGSAPSSTEQSPAHQGIHIIA